MHKMIKAAIVGCGKIADQHLAQINRIPGAEVVAVCDSEELMAKQLQERFQIKYAFSDLEALLGSVLPDVIHITTPPHTHLEIAKTCIEAGCHLYIEKPFTLDTDEAQTLLALAKEKGVKVTVGHNVQFTHVALRMREMVRNGYLGGNPVHMECYYCYDLGDPRYAKALLGDKDHWARKLPGKLLHNVINHGIAKIAEFIKDENPLVIAKGFTSPILKRIGENEIIDEARVIIYDRKSSLTAYFTFSTQMRPVLHQLRIYGPQNGLIVDDDNHSIVKLRGSAYKSYLEQLVPHLSSAAQSLGNLNKNLKLLIKRELHNDKGMKNLIESFYRSIRDDSPPPISYREIILTSWIMDEIFRQVFHKV